MVERNNHGHSILALAQTVCKYERIYTQHGQPGWLTTSISRPAVLARFDVALVEHPECFHSRALLAECRTFVRTSNGATGARPGTHDDRIMAMAIGLEARAELVGKGWR